MHTPEEAGSLPALADAREPRQFSEHSPLAQPGIDPDNPPWGAGMAILVWIASLFLLGIGSAILLIPYAAHRGITPAMPDYARALSEFALKDPAAIFLQVFSTLPAHVITVAIVWAVVTRFGRLPFWKTLGWSWGRYFGLWTSVSLGVVLFFASSALAHFLGGDKLTPLEEILNSSPATRYMIAFLATLTAPLVEEFVFRGVMYSALQRLMGKIAALLLKLTLATRSRPTLPHMIGGVGAVVFVTALFTAVHVPQYRTNYGVIAAVGLLSFTLTVIRAVSGRLLPCYIVHLVFNGIQSVIILWRPSGNRPVVAPDHAAALFLPLLHALHSII